MLSATLERLLNRGLPRSVRARQLTAQLRNRSVAVEVREFTRVRVSSNGATLAVAQDGAPADATLAGGPLALLALLGAAPEAVVQRGDVSITGDAEVARQFRELVTLLRPDPEEELSLLLGDVPAHQLGRLARSGVAWGAKAASTTLHNLAEYLGHERGHLVPRNEGEQFLRGVEAVREGVDRVAARIELLARRRGAP
jgi:ubiquinone biosynthesis accessory factor UbiJ